MLTPRGDATVALALEAASGPKPGNVDRDHDHDDVTLNRFLAGGVAVADALAAADGLGAAVESAARAMARVAGTNTQFGAAVLLAPLVAAGDADDVAAAAEDAIAATTSEDAARFFAAFDHVDVALPPADDLDARDPATRDAVRERGVTLADVMERSADGDDVAREWTEGYPRCRDAADRLERHHDADGGSARAVARTYLELLADRPDTHVATVHGDDVARDVRERAARVRDGTADLAAFDEDLVARGVNPGTTADVVAGGIYLALHRDGGFRP